MALSLESMDNNNSQQEEGKGDDMDLVLQENMKSVHEDLNRRIEQETLKLIDESALLDPDKKLKSLSWRNA